MSKFKKPSAKPAVLPAATNASFLRAWAEEAIRKRGFLLAIRLVRVRDRRLDEFTQFVPSDLGIFGLVAGAHLLGRQALPGDLIAVLGTTYQGRNPKPGDAIFLCARSPSGERIDDLWIIKDAKSVNRGQGLVRSEILNTEFLAPSFHLDPGTLAALAARRFPGADLASSTPADDPRVTAPASDGSAPARRAKPSGTAPPSRRQPCDEQDVTWETLATHISSLTTIDPFAQHPWVRIYTRGAVPPPRIESLPLGDLIESYGANAAFSVSFVLRMQENATLDEVAHRLLGAENIDLPIRAFYAVGAVNRTLGNSTCRGLAYYLGRAEELCRQLCGAPQAEYEVLSRLASDLKRSDELRKPTATWIADSAKACCMISALAAMAFWRLDKAMESALGSPSSEPPPAELPELVHARRLCSTLISIVSPSTTATDAPVSTRLRAALEHVVGPMRAASVRGRKKVLSALLAEDVADHIAFDAYRRTALFHAYQLHSIVVHFEMFLANRRRMLTREPIDYSRHDLGELFDVNRSNIARSMVIDAAQCSAPAAVISLLQRARDLAPHDDVVAACANEGEFRQGVRSADLLERLRSEGDDIGALAMAVVVAEALHDPRRPALLRKLVTKSQGDPAGFGPRVVVCLERPGEFADLSTVRSRLAELEAPPALHPRSRLVHAIFGTDPRATIEGWHERLARQAQVLAAAEAVLVERVEEALTRPPPPRRERPTVPASWNEDAAVDAVYALKFRLSRPAAATLPGRVALHRMARDWLALSELADVADTEPLLRTALDAWLLTLRGDAKTPGLIPSLDLAIATGDWSGIDSATERSRIAFDDVGEAAWLGQVQRRLSLLDAHVVAPAERERVGLLRARALGSPSAVERDLITEAISDLERERGRTRDAPVETQGEDAAPAGDSFRQMIVPTAALDRSRVDLDTPDWALEAGLRQVALYNASRGRRDLKMLASTRDRSGALWELRHHDARHPVRVLWRTSPDGPVVVCIMVKDDEADQRRVIERVMGWAAVD